MSSPFASETYSALEAEPLLVVDLDAAGRDAGEAAQERARRALARLPCPSVALCRGAPDPGAAPLVGAFDVVLSEEAALEAVVASVRARPLAALALVQLLRHNDALDVHEGLIAESLVYSTLQGGPEFAAWHASRRAPARPPAPDPEPAVLVLREGARLHLTLNRPHKRNAFSAAMRDGLVEGLQIALSDPSLEEVVLSGAGACFCAGGDLDEFGTLPDPATAHAIRSTRNVSRLIADCAARVHARLHGACVGAGVELPAFAGHVSASEDSFFQLPEIAMGLVPGAGGTVSLPRRIGRQRTAYLALTGIRLDARTALSWGLVDELAARHTGPRG